MMWHWYVVILLFLLIIMLCLRVNRLFDARLLKAKREYQRLQVKHDSLDLGLKELKRQNVGLTKISEEIIALYDITKEICKYLEEEKVFNAFRNLIQTYVHVEDCKLLQGAVRVDDYAEYAVFPLKINSNTTYYLAARGFNREDKDKLYILAQQLLLGIKRANFYQKIQELAIMDSLTRAFSRRYLMERFNEELARSRKFNYSFSVLMIDVDYFKSFNDRYGHLVGDAVLREVSHLIKESIRQIDLVGRYGGEEFLIILAETDKSGAQLVAERIRRVIENKYITVYDERLQVTVSIGIATFPADSGETENIIDKADQALYRAKGEGRNRVCVYERHNS